MHELGVVFYVIKDVNAIAKENNISKVASVTLQIGEVSGVVPHLLEDCFKWAAAKEPVMADSKLNIEEIKAVTFCEDCHGEYETVKYAKVCPHCGSSNTYLLSGNEFIIKEIEVYDETD